MSTEENKRVIARLIEEVNEKRGQAAVEQFLAPTYLDRSAPSHLPRGPEGWRQLRALVFRAFPDLRITVEEMIAEGDEVAVRFTMRATHRGELMGIPPTGKQITVIGIDINRFEGGKIAERWGNQDDLGMMQQLGVIPSPGQAG